MIRIVAGVFTALLLVASPALAQTGATMDQQASAANVNFASSTDAQIDEAMTATLQANLAAQAGVASLDELTDQELSDAVSALVASDPNLTTAQVTAIVRAAIRSRPSAAATLAAAAAAVRPDIGGAIRNAAISVAPAQQAQIRAAVRSAVVTAQALQVGEDTGIDFINNNASDD